MEYLRNAYSIQAEINTRHITIFVSFVFWFYFFIPIAKYNLHLLPSLAQKFVEYNNLPYVAFIGCEKPVSEQYLCSLNTKFKNMCLTITKNVRLQELFMNSLGKKWLYIGRDYFRSPRFTDDIVFLSVKQEGRVDDVVECEKYEGRFRNERGGKKNITFLWFAENKAINLKM